MPVFQLIYLAGVALAFAAFVFGLGGVWLWLSVMELRERQPRPVLAARTDRAAARTRSA